MSLKNFHIFFVICCTVMAWAAAYLFLAGLPESGSVAYIIFGILCLAAGILLPVYGRFFYRKMVKLGFYR